MLQHIDLAVATAHLPGAAVILPGGGCAVLFACCGGCAVLLPVVAAVQMEYQPGSPFAGTEVGTVAAVNTFLNTLTFKDAPTGVTAHPPHEEWRHPAAGLSGCPTNLTVARRTAQVIILHAIKPTT